MTSPSVVNIWSNSYERQKNSDSKSLSVYGGFYQKEKIGRQGRYRDHWRKYFKVTVGQSSG
jgi:hypothetical protein